MAEITTQIPHLQSKIPPCDKNEFQGQCPLRLRQKWGMFQVSGSIKENGPWDTLVEDQLIDTRGVVASLLNFTFEEPVEVQFLKFDLISYYGLGGGLQYFAAIPATSKTSTNIIINLKWIFQLTATSQHGQNGLPAAKEGQEPQSVVTGVRQWVRLRNALKKKIAQVEIIIRIYRTCFILRILKIFTDKANIIQVMRKRLMQNNMRLSFSPSSVRSPCSSSFRQLGWLSSSTRWRALQGRQSRRTSTPSTVSITKKRQRIAILGQIIWNKVMITWDSSTHDKTVSSWMLLIRYVSMKHWVSVEAWHVIPYLFFISFL